MEISGFDADSIVTQLMQLERLPLNALQRRKDAASTASDAISKIRSNLDAFRLAAAKLADVSTFDRFRTTVSSSDIASASVSGTAAPGSLSFTVDRLAQAHGLRSIGTVPSNSTTVTSAAFISVAAGTRSVGIDTVRAGTGLGAGTSVLKITQASAGATTSGTSLAPSTVIGPGNDTIDVSVNGSARTVTIAAGTYSADQLATAVQAAFDASGGGLTASIDTAGALQVTTTREGSAASLQITGGTALGDLGLAPQAVAATGTDGIIDVDGTLTTVTNAEAGQAVAVDTGSGTLDVTLSGGLRVGDIDVKTVSTGTRTLADVAAAINGANGGVSAAAVQVSGGAWRLQLSSRTTGDTGRIAIDTSVFSGIGGMIESSAAQNAQITIGSGPGAYQVEATGNTFANVMSGVSLTARTVSATAVTVDVTRNDDAVANDVAALVGAANTILADIKVQTRFDSVTGTSGVLAGNSAIRRLADQVRSALGGQVDGLTGTTTNGLASAIGIQVTREGSFTFDKSKFLAVMATDPGAAARVFGRGGTGSGSVTYGTAAAETRRGTYDVEVTTAATQATSATLFAGGAATSTRLGIRAGNITASIDITAGQTPAQIIAALNGSFAANNLDLVAEADGTGLVVRANDWGSAGNFELNTDVLGAGTWDAQDGVNVQGTIAGVTATGIGRRLSLTSFADSPAAGLAIDVAGGAIGAVGSITYQPGLAARVVEVATALTDADDGTLTSAKDAADRRVKGFTDQMTRLEDRLAVRELNLRRQYSSLQTLLGDLQSQGSWLSSQIAGLPRFES
jgi:flagellar hook-associated protein 2